MNYLTDSVDDMIKLVSSIRFFIKIANFQLNHLVINMIGKKIWGWGLQLLYNIRGWFPEILYSVI